MSTPALIEFRDERGVSFFVRRQDDGRPEVVGPEIDAAITYAVGRWSASEVGFLVVVFLSIHGIDKVPGRAWASKIPNYELVTGPAGDELYRWLVEYRDGAWQAIGPEDAAEAPTWWDIRGIASEEPAGKSTIGTQFSRDCEGWRCRCGGEAFPEGTLTCQDCGDVGEWSG